MLRSFSLLVLVVTLVIVLLLVARSWNSVAPTAMEIDDSPAVIDDRGESEAGEALRSGALPDLGDMRQQTDLHSQQVQEALAGTD